jgi:hypothetical protein
MESEYIQLQYTENEHLKSFIPVILKTFEIHFWEAELQFSVLLLLLSSSSYTSDSMLMNRIWKFRFIKHTVAYRPVAKQRPRNKQRDSRRC